MHSYHHKRDHVLLFSHRMRSLKHHVVHSATDAMSNLSRKFDSDRKPLSIERVVPTANSHLHILDAVVNMASKQTCRVRHNP
jgi:hypothetical protein